MRAAPVSDEALRLIQQAIAARALSPGDRLGTEAVRLLAQANLVRAARGPGGGVFVKRTADRGLAETISDAIAGMLAAELTSVSELIEVRTLLEVPLAGLAAERADDGLVTKLRHELDEANLHADDEQTQRDTDQRFHWLIAEASGNRVACALSAWSPLVLQPALKELIAPAIVEAVARDQHGEILAAIEARNPTVAERAMRDHLRYLSDLLETVSQLQD